MTRFQSLAALFGTLLVAAVALPGDGRADPRSTDPEPEDASMTLRGNALIGQSGGPTCVINQSLVGVVEEALGSDAIDGIYGAVHGVKGILEGKLIDLGRESKETLEAVANTPCAALRSVRKKVTREECEAILNALKAHDKIVDFKYCSYIVVIEHIKEAQ